MVGFSQARTPNERWWSAQQQATTLHNTRGDKKRLILSQKIWQMWWWSQPQQTEIGGQRFHQARTHDEQQWCPQQWVTMLQNLGGDKKKFYQMKTPDSGAHSIEMHLKASHKSFFQNNPNSSRPRFVQGSEQICTHSKKQNEFPKRNPSNTCHFIFKFKCMLWPWSKIWLWFEFWLQLQSKFWLSFLWEAGGLVKVGGHTVNIGLDGGGIVWSMSHQGSQKVGWWAWRACCPVG